MTTPNLILEALAGLRQMYVENGKPLEPHSAKIFSILQSADVASETWEIVLRRTRSKDDLIGIVAGIILAVERATLSHPAQKQKIARMPGHYTELLSCAERLRTDMPSSFRDGVLSKEYVDFQRSIAWAIQLLEVMIEKAPSAIKRELPASRKGGSKMAFQKCLCEKMEAGFGVPLYEFVSDISNALYPSDPAAMGADNIKKNYPAERAARLAGN